MWIPISRDKISADIQRTEYYLSGHLKEFWDLIKITPLKWQDGAPNSRDSFWVLAIWGSNVLFYNDIEEGYNVSEYHEHGIIDMVGANQSDLYEMIDAIYKIFLPK